MRHSWLLRLTLAGVAFAQTQSQIQSCANTIQLQNYVPTVSWSTDDALHYFNATFFYNPTLCLTPARVPVNRIYLLDINGGLSYNCPKPPFDTVGWLHTQCTQTLGSIATAAKGGSDLCKCKPAGSALTKAQGVSSCLSA
ncbi:hypothetical protein IAU60_001905 [Kwoniella sp. DSM 27419]